MLMVSLTRFYSGNKTIQEQNKQTFVVLNLDM